jgi:hypothetical protein
MAPLKFDELPDLAFVPVAVGFQVAGKKRSQGYADAKAGKFPKIQKLNGGRSSGIRVGELRRYLLAPECYRA